MSLRICPFLLGCPICCCVTLLQSFLKSTFLEEGLESCRGFVRGPRRKVHSENSLSPGFLPVKVRLRESSHPAVSKRLCFGIWHFTSSVVSDWSLHEGKVWSQVRVLCSFSVALSLISLFFFPSGCLIGAVNLKSSNRNPVVQEYESKYKGGFRQRGTTWWSGSRRRIDTHRCALPKRLGGGWLPSSRLMCTCEWSTASGAHGQLCRLSVGWNRIPGLALRLHNQECSYVQAEY